MWIFSWHDFNFGNFVSICKFSFPPILISGLCACMDIIILITINCVFWTLEFLINGWHFWLNHFDLFHTTLVSISSGGSVGVFIKAIFFLFLLLCFLFLVCLPLGFLFWFNTEFIYDILFSILNVENWSLEMRFSIIIRPCYLFETSFRHFDHEFSFVTSNLHPISHLVWCGNWNPTVYVIKWFITSGIHVLCYLFIGQHPCFLSLKVSLPVTVTFSNFNLLIFDTIYAEIWCWNFCKSSSWLCNWILLLWSTSFWFTG